eukprot:1158942-Pelagomonas_calceolata.AAC.5
MKHTFASVNSCVQDHQQRADWELGMSARTQDLMADVAALDKALAESTSRERHLQAQFEDAQRMVIRLEPCVSCSDEAGM